MDLDVFWPTAFQAEAPYEGGGPALCSPGAGHTWTFAYGANMGHSKLEAIGVEPSRTVAATLPGHELHFSKQVSMEPKEPAFAVVLPVSPHAGIDGVLHPVQGVVHSVNDQDLKKLDHSEGPLYRREQLPVNIGDGANRCQAQAWTYVSVKPGEAAVQDDDMAPSTRYARLIVCGAEEQHLPSGYVQHVRQRLEGLGVPGGKLTCGAPLHPHQAPSANLQIVVQGCEGLAMPSLMPTGTLSRIAVKPSSRLGGFLPNLGLESLVAGEAKRWRHCSGRVPEAS